METKIRDEGNGILIVEDSVAGVKCDTNRRIYCKNVERGTPYKYIGFDMPQGMTRENKRQHLIILHNALTEYNSTKQTDNVEQNQQESTKDGDVANA